MGRLADHRRREGGRDALRLRGGGRGRLDGGAARQALGTAGDRLGELAREGARRPGRTGADGAFDYHDDVASQLRALAPDGIDVYFDNVGGEQLEAAIGATRTFARIVLCGAISRYNDAAPPAGPRNLFLAIGRRLRLQGFIVSDHLARFGEFAAEIAPLIAGGELKTPTTFVDGLENAPAAFMQLLRPNANVGKLVVRV